VNLSVFCSYDGKPDTVLGLEDHSVNGFIQLFLQLPEDFIIFIVKMTVVFSSLIMTQRLKEVSCNIC